MKRFIFILAVMFCAAISLDAAPAVYNVSFGLPELTSIESPVRVVKHGSVSSFICGFQTSETYNEGDLQTSLNSILTAADVDFASVYSVSRIWQRNEYTITFRLEASETIGDVKVLRISSDESVFEIAVVSDDDGMLDTFTLAGEWDSEYEDDFRLSMNGSQYGVTYKLRKAGMPVATFTGDGNPVGLGMFRGENAHGTYVVEAALAGYTGVYTNPVTMANRFGLSTENHIAVKTYDSPDGASYILDVSYFDGHGFPVQDISVGGAADSRSLVRPVAYDIMRRRTAKEYLPFAVQGMNGSFISDVFDRQQEYYAEDTRPFVENVFEDGAAGRILNSRKAGDVYESAEKKAKVSYGIYDGISHIHRLQYSKNSMMSPVISNTGSYAAGELTYIETISEDNDTSLIFNDVFGKTLMTRRIDEGINYDTYYVYDLRDSLVCVIQPEGVAVMPATLFQFSGDFWQDYCFSYIYDSRGNLTERHIPGCGVERMAYDLRNRPVLYSDAMMHSDSTYRYTLYDNMDRIVEEGYIKGTFALKDVQTDLYRGADIADVVTEFEGMVTRLMTYYSDDFSLGGAVVHP